MKIVIKRRNSTLLLFVLCSMLFFNHQTAKCEDDATTPIKASVAKVFPALVRIYVVSPSPVGGRIQKFSSSGSGAIISPDGYVVTNHHVAGNSMRIVCTLSNNEREEIEAELVGTDPMADIAVLKLKLNKRKNPNAPLPFALWGNSDELKVGDIVMALGSPGSISQSVTQGIVSNTEMILPKYMRGAMKLDGENVGAIVRWIGHDAIIFGGNSGGPLINTKGEIVGINEIGFASLGGAIPSNQAKKVVNQIIANGRSLRSWSGITLQSRLKGVNQDKGVLVGSVLKDSPAKKCGIKAGDLLISIAGTLVNATVDEELPLCNRILLALPAEKDSTLLLLRDNKEVSVTLTPEVLENILTPIIEFPELGIIGRDFSRVMALVKSRENKDGLLVLGIRSGRATSEAKPSIKDRDVIVAVNGKRVSNGSDLKQFVKEAMDSNGGKSDILVEFERGKQVLLTVIRLGEKSEKDRAVQAKKAWLPLSTQVLTKKLAKALNIQGKKGVRISMVYKKLADENFPLEVGDILLAIDGEIIDANQIEDYDIFSTMVKRYRIGKEAEFKLIRGGKTQIVTVKFQTPPPPISEFKSYEDDTFELNARNLHPMDQENKDKEDTVVGVMISEVERSGWASLAGLKQGDILTQVNNHNINNVKELADILKKIKIDHPKRITFFVKRGIQTRFLQIEPNWN